VEELQVPESVPIELKRSAITLADELDVARAVKKLSTTAADLRKQIDALETQLCIYIFKPRQKTVELTEEGIFLIKAFRTSVALHDRNASKDADETQ
jgi:DNA-binding transcriptional LysR family regulator